MIDLSGKTALITGCSSGIGSETARVFVKQGAAVVIVARRREKLEELADELRGAGGEVLVVAGDVTAPDFPDEVVAQAVQTFGRVDILVNNAGIGDRSMATVRTTDELWDQVVAVNETAQFRFCRAVLKVMTQQGSGSIVNLSSIGGVYSIAGAAYSAAKAAVIGLTKNIGVQYAGTGIRCNAVCPGPTDTPMLAPGQEMDMEMLEIAGRHSDMTCGMSEPVDMANAIAFFASDEARYINGQILVIDKGSCI
ncbi:MAG: glucose 1-dehydrogenase [Oscillospiraceae bacterium]|nr:glucose 1-dehydrogenase [Oscillospiraceae bacterium]